MYLCNICMYVCIGTLTPLVYVCIYVCMYVQVSLFLPFTAPAVLAYYSSNITAAGSAIVPVDPTSFDVAPRDGQYYLNDNPNPTLTLTRGAKYSFVIKNADQRLFPLTFGRSFGTPYIASGAVLVTKGRSTCLQTYIHIYIHTVYMHTYIHYIYAYVHTYIHTHTY